MSRYELAVADWVTNISARGPLAGVAEDGTDYNTNLPDLTEGWWCVTTLPCYVVRGLVGNDWFSLFYLAFLHSLSQWTCARVDSKTRGTRALGLVGMYTLVIDATHRSLTHPRAWSAAVRCVQTDRRGFDLGCGRSVHRLVSLILFFSEFVASLKG